MTTPVLEVAGVSKRFCRDLRRSLRYGLADIAREFMPGRRPAALRRDEFWALDDVSFTLMPGEAKAVLGHNGAGKSTLLRIVAGLFPPDVGDVRIHGRVQSVIELGGGFHPLLTGRENARLLLSWQCDGSASRDQAIEAVCAFAELGLLFDAPVQSYSAGMRARLAFALATQMPSDLLLLDEVLAVGDQAFRQKCLNHIRSHLNGGGALLFVSHNVFQVQMVCQSGLVLDHGRPIFAGSAVDALNLMFERQDDNLALDVKDRSLPRFRHVSARAPDGGPIRTGGPLEVRLDYVLPEPVEAVYSIAIWTRDQSVCIAILGHPDPEHLPAGPGSRTCLVPSLPLVAGIYAIRAVLSDPATMHSYIKQGDGEAAAWLTVEAENDRQTLLRRNSGQLVMIDASWHPGGDV